MSDSAMNMVPSEKAAAEEGNAPEQFGDLNNLAGDTELCEKVRLHLFRELEKFRSQDERVKFAGSGGVMDISDRMWRVATGRRDTTSAQHQNTLSDIASSVFHRAIRAMSAGENSIYFQGLQLPGRYEPAINTDEYSASEGIEVATQRNKLMEYTFERDKRKRKVKRQTKTKNKYGHAFWCHEWEFRTESKRVKVLDRKKNEFRWETKKLTVADWPTWREVDGKNFFADATIKDIAKQRTVLEEQEQGWEELNGQQNDGFLVNVKKLTAAQLSRGDYEDETQEDRQTNADETQTRDINGLYKVWQGWTRIPIKEAKRPGKGKWDENVAPEWYWATFAGELSGGAICLRLIKNPYSHGQHPYFIEYAYDDDKGMYHISPAQIVESTYWQIVTNYNQGCDNVTLRNKAPYILKGSLLTRDATFRQNKIIKIGQSATLEPIKIERTTEITMELASMLEQEFMKALGVTKPIEGEAWGQRTSASEAMETLDQASKPLVEKADDNGTDFFTWAYTMDAYAWDQYGDPDTVRSITKNLPLQEVKPAAIWGPFQVTVTAVSSFEDKQSIRRYTNAFLQSGGYDRFAKVAGRNGERAWWRMVIPFTFPATMGERVGELVPPSGDFDATRRSIDESGDMLMFGTMEDGAFIEPKPEENQDAHLDVHLRAQESYENLPRNEINEGNLQRHRQHILLHQQFKAQQEAQGMVPGQAGQQQGQLQEGTPAELEMNPMEAQAGTEAAMA